jgi:cyclic pyranopterin phosphate synthase
MAERPRLTHLDHKGEARMVDVSRKDVTARTATAAARITMRPQTLQAILGGEAAKGDVLAVARVAGIMAAKRTHELIPLCHPLALSQVTVEFLPVTEAAAIDILATAKVDGKTGVEMEALTAAAVAALTIYDMVKSIDRAMTIEALRLIDKRGGKSGHFRRKEP